VAFGVAIAGPACSSGTDLETGELTQTEAAQLFSALAAAFLPTASVPSPAATSAAPGSTAAAPTADGPAAAPTTTSITDSTQVTVGCAAGGTVIVTSTNTVTITVDVVLNPSPDTTYVSSSDYQGQSRVRTDYLGCGSSDSQGGVWTFDADPGLIMQYDIDGTTDAVGFAGGGSSSASDVEWSGLWSGTLGWQNGGRSGQCSISMSIEGASSVVNGVSTFSYSQNGEICGMSVTSSSGSS
jgi:hypothetical protein